MQTIEADYLVIGAGAVGIAFVDALVSETQARVLLRLLAHPLGVVPIPGTKRAEYVRGERRRSRLPRRSLLAKPHCRRHDTRRHLPRMSCMIGSMNHAATQPTGR
jgi:hypothetical protein